MDSAPGAVPEDEKVADKYHIATLVFVERRVRKYFPHNQKNKIEARNISRAFYIKTGFSRPVPFVSVRLELARRAMLLEAVPAVHRAPLGRLERHFAFLAAVSALCRMHFSRATKAPSSSSLSKLHISHSLFLTTSPPRTMFALLRFSVEKTVLFEPSFSMVCHIVYRFSTI